MKWFKVDSDTVDDDRIAAVVERVRAADLGTDGPRRGWVANAVHGFLLDLWCITAQQTGAREPGYCEREQGRPLTVPYLAKRCDVPATFCQKVLDAAAAEGHIDPTQWAGGVVYLPGMRKRADEYTHKKLARSAESPAPVRTVSRQRRKPPVDLKGKDSDQDLLGKNTDPGRDQVDQLLDLWNAITTAPIPKVDPKRVGNRRTDILAALKAEANLAEWRAVITWVESHKEWKRPGFLANGRRNPNYQGHHPSWTPNLVPWMTRPGQFQKLREQMQAEQAGTKPGKTGGNRAAAVEGKYAKVGRSGPDEGGGGEGSSGGHGPAAGPDPGPADQGPGDVGAAAVH